MVVCPTWHDMARVCPLAEESVFLYNLQGAQQIQCAGAVSNLRDHGFNRRIRFLGTALMLLSCLCCCWLRQGSKFRYFLIPGTDMAPLGSRAGRFCKRRGAELTVRGISRKVPPLGTWESFEQGLCKLYVQVPQPCLLEVRFHHSKI